MQLSPSEIDPPCTVSQVAAALQPLISQPSSSAAPFTTSRLHLPTTTPSAASRRCARAAFDAFACSLPRYSGAHIPVSDWLFGAVPRDNELQIRPYRLYLILFRGQRAAVRATTQRSRRLLWRPPADSTCSASNNGAAWLLADVCATSNGVPPSTRVPSVASLERSYAWQQMRLAARAAQHVRRPFALVECRVGRRRHGGGFVVCRAAAPACGHRSARALVKRLLLATGAASRVPCPAPTTMVACGRLRSRCTYAVATRASGGVCQEIPRPRLGRALRSVTSTLRGGCLRTSRQHAASAAVAALRRPYSSSRPIRRLPCWSSQSGTRDGGAPCHTPRGEAWGGAAEGAELSEPRGGEEEILHRGAERKGSGRQEARLRVALPTSICSRVRMPSLGRPPRGSHD